MAELKTRATDASVEDFLAAVEHPVRRADGLALLELLTEVTGEPARMWGDSIVGFGQYRYTYATGRSGEWPVAGFSPRKTRMVLYIMAGFTSYDELMSRLGKHKTGRSCLYVNKLADVDLGVLRELVAASVAHMHELYPADP